MDELCSLQNKSLPQVLTNDFLHIYPYVCINEPTIQGESIDYILKHSQHELIYHLKLDIRVSVFITIGFKYIMFFSITTKVDLVDFSDISCIHF